MLILCLFFDRQTDRQTHQKYSSEPHKKFTKIKKKKRKKVK